MSGDFVWDDKQFISENPNILGNGFLRSFLFAPFGGFSGTDENSLRQDRIMPFYRPLVSLSYRIDFAIWGLNPAAFHLTNILIHTTNVALLFYILTGLGILPLGGFLGALLFSVYPLHFENVSWISGRTDLLAFLFAGLSSLLFLRWLRSRSSLLIAASAAAFGLGLLCKENVVLLPLALWLVLYRDTRQGGRSLLRLWPYAVSIAGWFVLRTLALGPGVVGVSGRSLEDFLAALGFYGCRMIWPFGLSLTVDSLAVFRNDVFVIAGAGLLAGLGASSWLAARKAAAAGWAGGAYVSWALFLLPSAIVIFSPSAVSLLAWRFLYLPSAVLLGALVYFLERRWRWRPLAVGAAILLAALYAAEIYPKNALFGKDESGFWLSLKNPGREDVIARYNIAVKSLPSDEAAALKLFDGILARPDQPSYLYWKTQIYEDLAVYYAFRRQFEKADPYFRELFILEPRPSLRLSFNYAFYRAFAGQRDEGERVVREKLAEFPRNHFVLTQAAKFYVLVHDYGRAAELYAEDYRLFRTRQSAALSEEAARLARKTP